MTQTGAIFLTLGIELPVAVLMVARLGWAPGRLRLVALASLAASTLTHPLLWMSDPAVAPMIPNWELRVAALEALIVVAEAAVYRLGSGLSARRALAVSFVANVASLGAGLLIFAFAAPP